MRVSDPFGLDDVSRLTQTGQCRQGIFVREIPKETLCLFDINGVFSIPASGQGAGGGGDRLLPIGIPSVYHRFATDHFDLFLFVI
jgi:hypothetical protein